MKKFGFTLTELIIALGVTAVAIALTLPAISDLMPDKNKMKVIELYNKINIINEKLLADKSLFNTKYYYDEENDKIAIEYSGFADTDDPLKEDSPDYYKNELKYPRILYGMLTDKESSASVGALNDGSYWTIKKVKRDITNKPYSIKYTFEYDLNGIDNGSDCYYSSSCKKPDTFVFIVDESGNVTAGDALTKAYLMNPFEMHSKKEDYKKAEEFLSDFDN